MLQKLRKRVLFSIALAGIIYLVYIVSSDFETLINVFSQFNYFYIPLLLLLVVINYWIRFWKWEYYLNLLQIKLPRQESLTVFLSGLIMSISPGKMGEMIKAYLIKRTTGTKIRKTGSVIFAERLTDFISLLIIAAAGAFYYNYQRKLVMLFSFIFIVIILIVGNRNLAEPILHLIRKIPLVKKFGEEINSLYENAYTLLRWGPLFAMTMVSLISWLFECLAYYIILKDIGIDVGLLWASFAYSFSIVAGALSMLPGGLGVTEGSLTLLVMTFASNSVEYDTAFASTFLIRVVTLWFAVLIGIVAISVYQKKFGQLQDISIQTNIEELS